MNGLIRSSIIASKRLYSVHVTNAVKKVTIPHLRSKYLKGTPLTMCTAYDYMSASWVQKAKCDILLVGDSLAMTTLGYESTTELPFDEFKYHVKSVCRAAGPSLVLVDMPFGSFEKSIEHGIESAVELMKLSSNVAAVKVELGPYSKDTYTFELVRQLCLRGIPVMGHIGLTPQRANSLGGFKVQGNKSIEDIKELVKTAQMVQEIGCWSILIECVPEKVARYMTEKVSIPTVGIGAGNGTSGQVLVISDLLGMQDRQVPKFVKKYSNITDTAVEAITKYREELEQRTFPQTDVHTFKIKDELWEEFIKIESK